MAHGVHLCWSHSTVSHRFNKSPSQTKVEILLISIRPVIIEKYCLVVRFWAYSEGDFENHWSVRRRHLNSPTPCSWEEQAYPGAMWASIEDDHIKRISFPSLYHEAEEFYLSIQSGWNWSDELNTVSFIRMFHRCLVAAGYRLRYSTRCPRLTLDHRRRQQMWAHGTRTQPIITGLQCYLLMRPYSVSTTAMGMTEFFVMLLKA